MKNTCCFVVPAPGHYGDETRVVSSHLTVESAKKHIGTGWCVRLGSLSKGDIFRRAAEDIYPVV